MAPAERRMVPDATPASYYGRPVLKAPTWRWPIPAYLFSGGLAAGTALAGAGARRCGDRRLALQCGAVTVGAIGASTAFLVEDLGRPSRFHHMLRVIKPTSPMSVGTWIFSTFAALAGLSLAAEVGERAGMPVELAGPVARRAGLAAAVVAPALATYTAVLVADTAVPAWHEARRHLPWVFAGSAAAAGAGAATAISAVDALGPWSVRERDRAASRRSGAGVRCLAVLGAIVEVTADEAMQRHLRAITTGDRATPDLAVAYGRGLPRRLALAARAATVAGGVGVAAGGPGASGRWRRVMGGVGGVALVAGSALERFAVFHAGRASAIDPVFTVGPQRAGLAAQRAGLVPPGGSYVVLPQ